MDALESCLIMLPNIIEIIGILVRIFLVLLLVLEFAGLLIIIELRQAILRTYMPWKIVEKFFVATYMQPQILRAKEIQLM